MQDTRMRPRREMRVCARNQSEEAYGEVSSGRELKRKGIFILEGPCGFDSIQLIALAESRHLEFMLNLFSFNGRGVRSATNTCYLSPTFSRFTNCVSHTADFICEACSERDLDVQYKTSASSPIRCLTAVLVLLVFGSVCIVRYFSLVQESLDSDFEMLRTSLNDSSQRWNGWSQDYADSTNHN
jgi:hypothetical protein